MALLKHIRLVLACGLAVMATQTYAQQDKEIAGWQRYENPERYYYLYDYYYGPDGYYARMKEKCDEGAYIAPVRYYSRYRYYGYPVYRRAKYAEDYAGRGYLYIVRDKKETTKDGE